MNANCTVNNRFDTVITGNANRYTSLRTSECEHTAQHAHPVTAEGQACPRKNRSDNEYVAFTSNTNPPRVNAPLMCPNALITNVRANVVFNTRPKTPPCGFNPWNDCACAPNAFPALSKKIEN